MTDMPWIEVFRADTPASRGITVANIAEVATFDCSEKPVPMCFGHPKSDTPAAGGVGAFKVEGNSLFARPSALTDAAREGIEKGEWLDRSMAFFDPTHEANPRPGKWTPRHLGLLGAAAPGIGGMAPLRKALAFDADGGLTADGAPADAVVYAGTPTPVHTIFDAKEPVMPDQKTPEQIAAEAEFAARETAQQERETAFAARVRSTFDATNNSALDALVTAGKITPAEVDGLKVAFAALDPEGAELTFGAGDKQTKATAAAHLLAFMAGLPKRVPLGDRQSPDTEFDAAGPKSAVEFNARVDALVKEKGMSWDAAAEQIAEQGA